MEFHPLADEYPLMPAHELGRLEEGMRQHGFDPRFPVVLFEDKILDGRNRWLAAQAAGVTPCLVDFAGGPEEARWFVQMVNEERRHLVPDWLQRRRAERIRRVADLRAAGASTRAIATAEGVSQTQVRDDLKASGEQGVLTCDVTGSDGKTYPAGNQVSRGCSPDDPPVSGKPARRSKVGKPAFSLKALHEFLGKALSEIDKLSREHGLVNAHGKPDCPEHAGLTRRIEELSRDAESWYRKLKKAKVGA